MAPSTSMDPSQPPSTRPAAAVLTTHTAPPTSSSRTASNSAIRASTASSYLPTRCVIIHGGSRRACVLAPLHTCWPGYMWVCMYACMNACMQAYMLGRRRRKGACHLLPPAGEVISHICSRFAEGVRRLVVGTFIVCILFIHLCLNARQTTSPFSPVLWMQCRDCPLLTLWPRPLYTCTADRAVWQGDTAGHSGHGRGNQWS